MNDHDLTPGLVNGTPGAETAAAAAPPAETFALTTLRVVLGSRHGHWLSQQHPR